jgi:hypothetical protein
LYESSSWVSEDDEVGTTLFVCRITN